MKINELKTPCYVIDEGKLTENLKILHHVMQRTGAKILLAQKAFSAETIFYTMSVYFMSVKVKKTRYTLPGALFATTAGIVASVFLVWKT